MSKFNQDLRKYQNHWVILQGQVSKLNDLTTDFQLSDLNDFLESIKACNKEKDSIQVSNILAILSNEEFQNKLNAIQKKHIVDFLFNEFNDIQKDYSKYKDLWKRIRAILEHYWDLLETKKARLLFKNKSLVKEYASYFIEFFRKKNSRADFDKALSIELLFPQKNWSQTYYHIDPESLEYIFASESSINKLLQILKRNELLAVDLLEGRSWEYSVKYAKAFLNWIKSLDFEQLKNLKTIFLKILAFEYDNKHNYETLYHQKDLLKSDLFHKLGGYLVKKDKDFFWRVFSLYDNDKKYIYDESVDFFIYNILPTHVEKFVNSNTIPDWMIVHLYYKIRDSKRAIGEKKQILGKFIKYKWDLIKANELAVEKNKEQELKRIEGENSKKRSEIEDLIKQVTDDENLMSERLLWYYENNSSLFLENEKEIVKSQINKILTSPVTYNPALVDVAIDESNPSSFTRTQYMGNNTIPRCVKIALQLGMDITGYQNRLVEYLPFAFDDPTIDRVLKPLSLDQIELLIKVYKKWTRKDDLRLLHPYKLDSLHKQWLLSQMINGRKKKSEKLLSEFIKVLQELISEEHPRIHNYAKKGFIRMLWDLVHKDINLNEQYFIDQFKHYINDPQLNYFNDILPNESRWTVGDFDLWIEYNLILIEKYQNTEAKSRRIKQLLWLNIELEEPISGVWYPVTRLMSELGIWDKEKRFYDSLIQNIEYPDFEDEIIEVLKHSFVLKQENNLAVTYLQGFVARYYRLATDPKEAIIHLKSKVVETDQLQDFLQWYLYRHLDRSPEQIEIFELKNKNRSLGIENAGLKDKLKTYNWENLLFVEGKCDKWFLELAYQKLKQQWIYNDVMSFRITIAWWANWIISLIASYIENDHSWKLFWLCDRDKSWMAVRKTNDQNVNEAWKHYFFNQDNNKRTQRIANEDMDINQKLYVSTNEKHNTTIMLLPVPTWFENRVYKNDSHSSDNQTSILKNTYAESLCEIEDLLYFDGVNDLDRSYTRFEKRSMPWWWESIFFASKDKKAFYDMIITNHTKIPNSVRENFKPIFDYILSKVW